MACWGPHGPQMNFFTEIIYVMAAQNFSVCAITTQQLTIPNTIYYCSYLFERYRSICSAGVQMDPKCTD